MTCGQSPSGIFLAPGSQKWYWFEFTVENLGLSTITEYTWTVPVGFASIAEAQAGGSVGILLSATGDAGEYGDLWLEVVTDADEILQHKELATITEDAQ